MSKNWFDHTEWLLIILMGGFAFWPNGVSTTCIIVLVVVRLIQDRKLPKPNLHHVHLLIPLLLIVGSWALYGFNPKGLPEIRLLPLMIAAAVYFHSAKTFVLFQKAFIFWSAFQSAFIVLFFAFMQFDSSLSLYQQIRDTIGEVFHLHPTFLSVAWSWAVLLCAFQLKLNRSFKASIIFTLLFGIVLTGGKMPMVALFGAGLIMLFLSREVNYRHKIIIAASGLLLFLALLFTPIIGQRFHELTQLKTEFTEGDLLSSSELRFGIWQCAASSINENFWTGVGVGNSRQTLETCFEKYEQVEFFNGEYNTHNQWMHFWLTGGLFSFLIFTAFISAYSEPTYPMGNMNSLVFSSFLG